jgi:hypothetical protein
MSAMTRPDGRLRRAGGRTWRPPSVGGWTLRCAAAEAIGMAAAAGAMRQAQTLVGGPASRPHAVVALLLVVAGGVVEGTALGLLQAGGLRTWLPRLRRGRWVAATVAVAGLGWAAVSAPAALAGPQDGTPAPGWQVVVGGGALLGAGMGAVLGWAQSLVLRRHVRFPGRWVAANALAWGPAMAVIFLGAGTPGADWPLLAVVLLGAATGVAAGAVLGVVTGWFLPSLAGPAPVGRALLAVLGSPAHRLFGRSLLGLRVRGVLTGRTFQLPVTYAAGPAGLVVVPGRPETKRWWRNLREASAVQVLLDGRWRPAVGVVLRPDDPGYDAAVAAYRRRWPRSRLPAGAPVVRIGLATGSE